MEKEKDDLLAAFENPDISTPEVAAEEPATEEPVEPTPVEPEEVKEETKVVEEKVETKEEPVVEETVVSNEPTTETSLKKNMTFIFVLCAVIALFIIFLPQILSFLSGGTY